MIFSPLGRKLIFVPSRNCWNLEISELSIHTEIVLLKTHSNTFHNAYTAYIKEVIKIYDPDDQRFGTEFCFSDACVLVRVP